MDAVFSLYLLKLERRFNPQEKGRGGSGGGGATVPPVGGLYIQYTIKFHVSKRKKNENIDGRERTFLFVKLGFVAGFLRRSEFKKCVLPRLHRRFKAQELEMGAKVFVQDGGPEKEGKEWEDDPAGG